VFDAVTTHWRWLAKFADVGYTLLLYVNKVYNNRRVRKGLPYYSLSKDIKQKVKSAVSYFSDFEKELSKMATAKGMDGVICGHIHHPAITTYNNMLYMNSGDWLESLSALVEDEEGNWNIIHYTEWQEEMKKLKELSLSDN
jgi:UDP-2,3-diacylglucosamine pyrophosphatase LpxH